MEKDIERHKDWVVKVEVAEPVKLHSKMHTEDQIEQPVEDHGD